MAWLKKMMDAEYQKIAGGFLAEARAEELAAAAARDLEQWPLHEAEMVLEPA
jgi:hypothetical protein